MSWDLLGLAAGLPAVISIVLEWFPQLSTWWHALEPLQRRLINAALVLVVNTLALMLVCSGIWETTVISCPDIGFVDWLVVSIVGLFSSFVVHQNTKR